MEGWGTVSPKMVVVQVATVVATGFVQVLESWKSYGFAFYDFKGPEKFGNTAQYEKFLKIYIG